MKYYIDAHCDNIAQFFGTEPHSDSTYTIIDSPIDAESPDEAIALAIDAIVDTVSDNGYTAVAYDDQVVIYDNGVVQESYYGFSARLEGETDG